MTTRDCVLFRSSLLLATVLAASPVLAVPITVDFESFGDLDTVTTQIAGLTFSNTAVLTAGISLNELDFPPHSGANVAFNSGDPITIDFSSPLDSFAAYFTYLAPVTLQAFDSAATLLGSVTSAYASNYVSDGLPASQPNELLQLTGLGLISRVTITGLAGGGSFVMDDLTATPGAPVTVPEPGTLALLLAGCLGLALRRRALERAV